MDLIIDPTDIVKAILLTPLPPHALDYIAEQLLDASAEEEAKQEYKGNFWLEKAKRESETAEIEKWVRMLEERKGNI